MVERACSNGIYGYKKEFEKLPPLVQKIIGSPSQIKDWAMCDMDVFNTVIASNFQRAYRTEATRQGEYNALPPEIRALADSLSERMLIGNGGNDDSLQVK